MLGLREGIAAALAAKFGTPGMRLLQFIILIDDPAALVKIQRAIQSAATVDDPDLREALLRGIS